MNNLELADLVRKQHKIFMLHRLIKLGYYNDVYPMSILYMISDELDKVSDIIDDRIYEISSQYYEQLIDEYKDRPSYAFKREEFDEYIDRIYNGIIEDKMKRYL